MAYGQTGSGKTHSLLGGGSEAGIISLAAEDLFAAVHLNAGAYRFKVLMLEVYNEELQDLLAVPEPAGLHNKNPPKLQIQEASDGSVRVGGLTEETVKDAATLKALLHRGNQRRQSASHRLNSTSSRSHALFQVTVTRKDCFTAAGLPQEARLNFVDLAGSERLAKSGNEGDSLRVQESTRINMSLLMLGNVISALAEAGPTSRGTAAEVHVPYRNSKLTRLLQPYLGGSGRIILIATINPAAIHAEETSHTLRFAGRAMGVISSEVQRKALVGETPANQALKEEVRELRRRLALQEGDRDPFADLHRLRFKVHDLKERNLMLGLRLEALTGEPPSDSVPPTPPDLELPSQVVRDGAHATADKALKLISRLVASSGGSGLAGVSDSPAGVVARVRRMRAERDQLRMRDASSRLQLACAEDSALAHQQLERKWEQLEEAMHIMEAVTGSAGSDNQGQSPLQPDLVQRLKEVAETVAVSMAELGTLQRQNRTLARLLQQEEARSAAYSHQLQEEYKGMHKTLRTLVARHIMQTEGRLGTQPVLKVPWQKLGPRLQTSSPRGEPWSRSFASGQEMLEARQGRRRNINRETSPRTRNPRTGVLRSRWPALPLEGHRPWRGSLRPSK
eukprot:jgi/Botrbrau1/12547/Bobra.0169s0086.2